MDLLIFPNQLFARHPGLKLKPSRVVLIEDSLFFGDAHHPLRFHKQKLWFHRATMKRYEAMLQVEGFQTVYIDYDSKPDSLGNHLKKLCKPRESKPSRFVIAHPTDFLLEKRLTRHSLELDVELEFLPTLGFINSPQENFQYRAGKKRWLRLGNGSQRLRHEPTR